MGSSGNEPRVSEEQRLQEQREEVEFQQLEKERKKKLAEANQDRIDMLRDEISGGQGMFESLDSTYEPQPIEPAEEQDERIGEQ